MGVVVAIAVGLFIGSGLFGTIEIAVFGVDGTVSQCLLEAKIGRYRALDPVWFARIPL